MFGGCQGRLDVRVGFSSCPKVIVTELTEQAWWQRQIIKRVYAIRFMILDAHLQPTA